MILIIAILFYVSKSVIDQNARKMLYAEYDTIMSIFNNAKHNAYQKIFREQILVHANSGYKMNQVELIKLQSEYSSIVFIYCGSHIIEDLIMLYGSIDTLVAQLATDLVIKIQNDEVLMISPEINNILNVGNLNG
jgi:hypothetical protein